MHGSEPRFESAVDRAIREAAERGAFDNLPGAGKPLPGSGEPGPVDENWWIRGYLRREGLSGEALLPPSVQLRKELDRIDATVARLADERAVREHVAEVNARVVEHMRYPTGPQLPIRKLDPDAVVARWRAARSRSAGRPEPACPRPAVPAPGGSGSDVPVRGPAGSGSDAPAREQSGPGPDVQVRQPVGPRPDAPDPAGDGGPAPARRSWWARLFRRT